MAMKNRRDWLPSRFPQLFHECWSCHAIGLKPGILGTRRGDYGMRDVFKEEPELVLNEEGLCEECAHRL